MRLSASFIFTGLRLLTWLQLSGVGHVGPARHMNSSRAAPDTTISGWMRVVLLLVLGQ